MKTYAKMVIPGSQASRYAYYLTYADATWSMRAIDDRHISLVVELPKDSNFDNLQELLGNIAESCNITKIEVSYE